MSRIIIFGKLIFKKCSADFLITVPTFSAALSADNFPSGIAPQGGVVLGAV